MTICRAFFPGRITPGAPAARMAASSTRDMSFTSSRSRVMQWSTDSRFSAPPTPCRMAAAIPESPPGAETALAASPPGSVSSSRPGVFRFRRLIMRRKTM